MDKIRLGLPKGSLNTIGRADTHELFVDAGFEIRGYEPGEESDDRLRIVNDPRIIAYLARPQSAPVELITGLLDIAIIGEDWVQEETVNGKRSEVRRVGDLEYGGTRLVAAISNELPYESLSELFEGLRDRQTPIICFTEYVNLTRGFFMRNEAYRQRFGDQKPLVRVRGFTDGENDLVRIIHSDGVTEGFIAKGADIVVDNSQTGSSLRRYGLKELEQIMKSSAGLYAGPSCVGWKEQKAQQIFEQLYGVIVGKRYFDVKFNVPNERLEELRGYLTSEKLYSAEPTIITGERFSQVNILIPKEGFPETLTALKSYGAQDVVRGEVKQVVR